MKSALKLPNQRIVEDLHDLKKYIKTISPNNFREKSAVIYEWIKDSYLDDELAEKIFNSQNTSEMTFLINKKLQTNLIRKLRLIEEEPQKVKKPQSFIPKVILAQSREDLINKMREVHEFGK